MDFAADAQPQMLDLGIRAQQGVGHRAGEGGFVGHQHRDLAQHRDHARGRSGESVGGTGLDASRRQNTSATRCSLDEK